MFSIYNLIAKRNLRGKSLLSTEECFLLSGSGLATTLFTNNYPFMIIGS